MEARHATKGASQKELEMIDQEEVSKEANKIIAEAKLNCEDRGEGFKPRHIYLEGSTKCVCGDGPDLERERMK